MCLTLNVNYYNGGEMFGKKKNCFEEEKNIPFLIKKVFTFPLHSTFFEYHFGLEATCSTMKTKILIKIKFEYHSKSIESLIQILISMLFWSDP